MNRLKRILPAVALMALFACSDNDTFTVKGTIEGRPTMNLIAVYDSDGAVRTVVTPAREGSFEFKGVSKQPTTVEIVDNEYRVMGRVYISNGETVEVELTRLNPYKIKAKGNDISQRWAAAVAACADSLTASPQAANRAIEAYISEHPDDPVATLMFATSYDCTLDPERADSVLQSIPTETMPKGVLDGLITLATPVFTAERLAPIDTLRFAQHGDTVYTFASAANTRNMLIFSNSDSNRKDSIVGPLRSRFAKQKRVKNIVDVYLDADTFAWKRTIGRDTANWAQAWAPGGLINREIARLAIPRLPYYIVTDSAGRQIYRGESLTAALDSLK